MLLKHPPDLVMDLLLVQDSGEQDTDPFKVILEIGCLIVQNEGNLSLIPKNMLLPLALHVPLALFPCRGCIFTVIPENTHNVPLRSHVGRPGVKGTERGVNVSFPGAERLLTSTGRFNTKTDLFRLFREGDLQCPMRRRRRRLN
jgi:hypothetical protein